jgi:hypothetical protein
MMKMSLIWNYKSVKCICILLIALLAFNGKQRGLLTSVLAQYELYSEFLDGQPKCDVDLSGICPVLDCLNFAAWSQVAGLVNARNLNLSDICVFYMQPAQPLVLTGELDLHQMFALVNSMELSSWPGFLFFQISGAKGVDVVSGWTPVNDKSVVVNPTSSVQFLSSTLSFYMNGEAPGQYSCTEEYTLKNLTKITFFNYFDSISFEQLIVYDSAHWLCPYLFSNARLSALHFKSLVQSFLVTNLFRFQQVSSSSAAALSSINSSIIELGLSGYDYHLDESLMHPLVYERVQTIIIEGSLTAIQSNLFKSFKSINNIGITVLSLANFFHRVDVGGWASCLQNCYKIPWITFAEGYFGLPEWLNPAGTYAYPNRDLGLFAELPLTKLVPVLNSNLTEASCTDTLTWLTQNYPLFNLKSYGFTDNAIQIYRKCWNVSFKPNMTAIEMKIEQFKLHRSGAGNGTQQLQGSYKIYFDYYEFGIILQFVNDLLEFILIPFACILGLALNARVIWIVYKNNKADLKEAFYRYMGLNSVFNCLFCIVYALYPINYCQRYETGYFCSTIYTTVTAQVIKIVFQTCFGEVFKMCSNITYICIAINRYMLVGKEHNSTLKNISKLNIKRVVFFTVVFSALMNIGHVFQYRINYGREKVIGSGYFTADLYPSIVNTNFSFEWYSMAYFIINFALFFLINTYVEIIILHNLRKEIADKRIKMEAEIQLSKTNNTSGLEMINKIIKWKQKKIEKDAKKSTRAIVMVITNSGLNFIFRFPEILVFLSSNASFMGSMLNFAFVAVSNALNTPISSLLVNSSYLFYIISFSTNVAIYVMFNPIFKQHFIWWESNVNRK